MPSVWDELDAALAKHHLLFERLRREVAELGWTLEIDGSFWVARRDGRRSLVATRGEDLLKLVRRQARRAESD